jgi:NADH-quinone oxidoreductase subunit N
MNDVTWSALTLLPAASEIFMLVMACVVLVAGLYARSAGRTAFLLAQLALAGALLLTVVNDGPRQLAFEGQFVADSFGSLLKIFIYLVTSAVLLYSRDYLTDRGLFTSEFHVLILFAVLGMMVMVSANHFIALYLGLELMSLSIYALVALDRDNSIATEAAMKYFVLGAIASGMLLYGMSLLYGLTGSLEIAGLSARLQQAQTVGLLAIFALAFVVAGLAFKLGAAPFHMWLPDVYQGAPSAVTLFLSAAPKIAGLALLMRLVGDGLSGLHPGWQDMLVVLAALSLLIGNVIAIAQTNIKRMLAYSAISHVGFLLLGVLAGDAQGYAAAVFYTLVYALTAAGAFGMVVALSRKGVEADQLMDFKGLGERSPWLAFLMLLLMFSMAGVPPTVGFYAKLMVLKAAIGADLIWLAVYAILFAIVGAYYYLRVVKLMYFDAPDDASSPAVPAGVRVCLSGNGLLMLGLGVLPGGLMGWCVMVASQLYG